MEDLSKGAVMIKIIQQGEVVEASHIGEFYIGIGSTLTDVLKYIGNYKEVYDTYELENILGICFELEDVDEWDWDGDWEELAAPIEWIFVYDLDF